MDDRTSMFLIFLAFGIASVGAGYVGRVRGIVKEAASRPLHLFSLVVLWSPVAMLSYWGLPIAEGGGSQLLLITLFQPVMMVAAASAMGLAMRRLRTPPEKAGVMIVAAGLSNHGFTLGAYLCYALLNPGEVALRYGIAYVMSMSLFNVLLFYPVAQHFARRIAGDDEVEPVARLVVRSLVDIRAMPLYLSALGVVLNFTGVPLPTQIADWHIMDILFFAGAGTAYAGIGLRLHVGHSLTEWKMHGLLGLAQFGWHPIATFAALAALPMLGVTVDSLVGDVIMIEAFMPTAINVVILANLFHLDARFASGLWLWNSAAFCVFVLPVLLWVW